jgi:hypothetical protein
VVEQGGGGVFVPPGDPAAMAQAIRDLARDPAAARRMGHAGREYVAAHFDRGTLAIGLETALKRAAAARGRP